MSTKVQDVSVDCETLSLKDEACILSIGAVKFDIHDGTLGDTFSRVVDIEQPGGGVIDASTVAWWMRQKPETQALIFGLDVNRVPLMQALVEFSEWLGFTEELPEGEYPKVRLWQCGDRDRVWLESAYKGTGLVHPWKYWQWKDQRTIRELFPHGYFAKNWQSHGALPDAMGQAGHLIQAFAILGPVLAPIYEQGRESWDLEHARQDTLAMAYFCGLETIGEAMDNMEIHASQLFNYEDIDTNLTKMHQAFAGIMPGELVVDHLERSRKALADWELEEMTGQAIQRGAQEELELPEVEHQSV